MNHKGKSQHDPNVWWVKDVSKSMKIDLIKKILDYQDGSQYTREELEKKNLNRLKEIWDKINR